MVAQLASSRRFCALEQPPTLLRCQPVPESHADPPDVKSAEEHYRQALARADELGMRPLVAHCHLGLGTLYQRTGKRAEAHEHLTTATTMYREMCMTYWLEQAEAVLRKLA